MASRLCPTARRRAVDFIQAHGTNLLRELYDFHFEDGSAANVLAALGHYQNSDGGFGHGLEADLRTKQSSVIATTVGLQLITETGAFESSMARDAIRYLEDQFTGHHWPLINADCNDAPHAPWWTWDETMMMRDGFHPNPSAEVLSYLITWCAMGKSTRQELLDVALDHIANNTLEMHDLLCYLRLFETPKLPGSVAKELLPALLSQAYELVKVRAVDWEEYGLTPLDVVTRPTSPLASFFGEALEANFEHRIGRQNEDGSWSPTWSWGNSYPEAWRHAEREIKGILTLRFLIQLKAFDRLD